MKKEAKDKEFLKRPTFKGGDKALSKFIADHLRYPSEALQKAIEGTVAIKYTIDHKGGVVDTKILTRIGGGLDEEAVRLVKLLKFDVPPHRGLKILFHKDLQIHFRLPRQIAAGEPHIVSGVVTEVQYSLTPTTAVTELKPSPPPSSSGYNYTVSW